ncbi:MAG: TIGR03663 family protein [Candidatus Hinthialibacter antarcticus]|nr:TIGR03663 family protein [Candidatus Hinthialibacter antarcticus]
MPDIHEERIAPISMRVALIVAAIALFGAFLRLYQLDYMAFHHDESIHAYYAHQLYQGNMTAYKYDPTYHGPFLYHYGALFFMLFGDSDIAARLPFVSFGLLMMYFVWRLRPWTGTYGALFSMALVAISPTMSYFSRFARNDIYIATAALGVLLFALEFLRDRKHSQLVWMTFWLALMYCIKENSYMTGFILGSFVTFYAVYYVLSAGSLLRKDALASIFVERSPFVKITALYALFSCGAFSLVYFVTRAFGAGAYPKNPNRSLDLSHMYNLRTAWSEYISEHAWVQPFWLFLFGGLTITLLLALAWTRSRFETVDSSEPLLSRIAKNNLGVLTAVLVALATYAFLFTTMGYNSNGMKAGVIDYLLYWMGQQDNPRIAGAPTYFLPRLFIYEISALLIGTIAYLTYTLRGFGLLGCVSFQFAMAAVVYTYSRVILYHGSSLITTLLVAAILLILAGLAFVGSFFFNPFKSNDQSSGTQDAPALAPDGVRTLFIYWTLTSVMIYAMLHEKVPWLLTHQAFPLLLLAGVFLGDVFSRLKPGVWRHAFLIVVVVLFAYQARTSILLNFYNPDSPRELMVYTQSDHNVKQLVDEMAHAAFLLGPDYRPTNTKARPKKPIAVIHDDPASWPYSWYLRNYNFLTISAQQMPPSNAEDVPFAILNPGIQDRMAAWTKGKYIKQQMPHRVWWPMGQKELPFEYYRNRNRPLDEAFDALWRYMLRREMWNENDPLLKPGSSDVVVYRRHPLKDPEVPPELPKGYDKQPRPLEVTAQVGRFGAGPGEFNEPRGVALSPDEKTLYVVDARNGRVQVFNAENDLTYVATYGEPGTGDGQFSTQGFSQYDHGPSGGIAVAPDGTIYITDTWRFEDKTEQIFGRIVRFTKDGDPLPSLTPPDGPFFFPRGLAVDSLGVLYVADTGANRIVRFAPDGTYLGVFLNNVVREPVGVKIAKDGTVYVCDVGGKRVVEVNANGQFIKDYTVYGWSPTSEVAMQWIEPYIDLDPAGNIYVTDSTANMVHAFLKTGNEVVLIGGTGSAPGNLNRPKGMLVDSRYQVYIADSKNNRVIRGIVR